MDLYYRMLNNRELFRATGFDDAEFESTFRGAKAEDITAMIGNAVPVGLARAHIRAILAH